MVKVYPYLTFPGNCRNAMSFYQECLGGELEFYSLAETPFSDELPKEFRTFIVEAVLQNDQLIVFGSDMFDADELVSGNRTAMLLTFESEEETREAFQNLSQNALNKGLLKRSTSGSLIGDLTDQFGNQWIIKCIGD